MKKTLDIESEICEEIVKDVYTSKELESFQGEETLKAIQEKTNKYVSKAKTLLKKLTSAEFSLKSTRKENGKRLFDDNETFHGTLNKIYLSQLKDNRDNEIILKLMKDAYSLIMSFREDVLNEKIEYLIGTGYTEELKLSVLTIKDILKGASLGTMSGGGLKLNIVEKDIKKFINNNKKRRVVNEELLTKVKEALELISSINGTLTKKEFFEKNKKTYTGDNPGSLFYVNEGYALEAALVAALDKDSPDLKILENRYKAYAQAIQNTGVFRGGGDLGKNLTESLKELSEKCKNLQAATELQVKRIAPNSMAQLVTLDSLVYELGSIVLLIKKMDIKRIVEFLKSNLKSKNEFEKIKKSLSKNLKADKDIQFVVKTLNSFFEKEF